MDLVGAALGAWEGAAAVGALAYAALTGTALVGLTFGRKPRPAGKGPTPEASVVAAVRDEIDAIPSTLDSLLAQHYPRDRREIIIVDDHSRDGTAEILAQVARNGEVTVILNPSPAAGSPKKAALTAGVQAARGKLVALTDGDCRHRPDWLEALVQTVQAGADMAVGQARFELPARAPLWQRLQALDFTAQNLTAAGLIRAGVPFTCSGASLAFRRDAFHAVGGWENSDHLASGDDELLMHKFVRAGLRVAAVSDRAGVVLTRPPQTLRELWNQRARWASKGLHYGTWRTAWLAGVFLFLAAITAGPAAVAAGAPAWIWLSGLALKTALDGAVLAVGAPQFGDRIPPGGFLLAEALHPPAVVLLALAGSFGGFRWKGRVYRRGRAVATV